MKQGAFWKTAQAVRGMKQGVLWKMVQAVQEMKQGVFWKTAQAVRAKLRKNPQARRRAADKGG